MSPEEARDSLSRLAIEHASAEDAAALFDAMGRLLPAAEALSTALSTAESNRDEARASRDILQKANNRHLTILLALIDGMGVRYDDFPQDEEAAKERAVFIAAKWREERDSWPVAPVGDVALLAGSMRGEGVDPLPGEVVDG